MSLRPTHVISDPPRPVLHSAHVIDGKSVSSPTTKDVVNPATEDVFAHVPVATHEQLEDAVAAEKRKPEGTRDDARIKRVREEIEKGVPPKSRGTLIVEFSIENIQVVQRRAAKTGKDGTGEVKARKGGKEQKAAVSAPCLLPLLFLRVSHTRQICSGCGQGQE